MIQEIYVSFKTAKFLKQKGFDEPTFAWYTQEGILLNRATTYKYNSDKTIPKHGDFVAAPTLQLVCKWLREVHNIYIAVNLFYPGKYIHYTPLYYVGIFNTLTVDDLIKEGCSLVTDSSLSPREYTTPEEAYEEGIRYCLENLI